MCWLWTCCLWKYMLQIDIVLPSNCYYEEQHCILTSSIHSKWNRVKWKRDDDIERLWEGEEWIDEKEKKTGRQHLNGNSRTYNVNIKNLRGCCDVVNANEYINKSELIFIRMMIWLYSLSSQTTTCEWLRPIYSVCSMCTRRMCRCSEID